MKQASLPANDPDLREKIIRNLARHRHFMFYDSCGTLQDRYGKLSFLGGASDEDSFIDSYTGLMDASGWRMGILPYDLKNHFEKLHSENPARIEVPEVMFFHPKIRIWKERGEDEIRMEGNWDWKDEWEDSETVGGGIDFQVNETKDEYLATVRKLQQHIAEGDVYEINYCLEFFATAGIDPVSVYLALTKISPVPFAAIGRINGIWLICASPERFLRKQENLLLTQPIKGTIRRGKDAAEDEQLKAELLASVKDRAENVMIVDLSRNDLNRVCRTGSVHVPSLFEVQAFPQVHHLVSTIAGTLRDGVKTGEILAATFPPGSMTGAPKIRSMELIDRFETFRRSIYSGCAGYITPSGDFDFNVIIRSLMWEEQSRQLIYAAGGAITWDSLPENEYEEILLKASAIRSVL